jgi:hypothetical protein
MASGVESLPSGIVDGTGVPATAKLPANFRVLASSQPVGVVGDVISFTGVPTVTGAWLTGSFRVLASGLPVVNVSSTGTTVLANGSPGGPPRLAFPSQRVVVA